MMAAQDHPQTNFRLHPKRYAVLEAAAFVLKAGTPRKLTEQIVNEAIDGFERLESVRMALQARRDQEDIDRGQVADLSKQRRRSRRDLTEPDS
jgi:hypothetical protein